MRIVRKGIACVLTVALLAAMTACGKDSGNNTTTPTETATPTAAPEVTPTGEATPTGTPEVTPEVTPALTGTVTPVVYDSRECWLTMTASKEWDARVVGDIAVVHLTDNNEEEKLFSASDYVKEHSSELESEATSRIAALHKKAEGKEPIGTENADFLADEKLEYLIDIGDWGIVELYSYAVVHVRFGEYANTYTDYFAITCRSVALDGSQKYATLYEKKSENLGRDDSVSRSIRINPVYAPADKKSEDSRQPRKVLTEVSYEETTGEDLGSRTYSFSGYFVNNSAGELSEILLWRCSREETTEWPYVIGGALYDAEGHLKYDQDDANWTILSYRLSELANSLYRVANGEKPTVTGLTVKDGVFSAKESLNKDWTICVELELRGDDILVRCNLEGLGAKIYIDEVRRTAFQWTSNYDSEGITERLQTSVRPYNYAAGSELTVKDNAVSEMTVRYFPKDSEKATQVFEPEVYLAENKARFTADATKFEEELAAEYKGDIVYRTNLLKEVPLGGFGSLLVYETAAYGETPKQVGSTVKMYRYEVSYLLICNGSVTGESVLYNVEWTEGATPKGAENFLVINHTETVGTDNSRNQGEELLGRMLVKYESEAFTGTGSERSNPTKDDVMTVICLGRRFEESGRDTDDEEYYVNKVYVDVAGNRLLDHFDTRTKTTEDARALGSEIREASGKVDFTYLNTRDIEVMSHSMRQVAAAFIAEGADYSLRITETVPAEVTARVQSQPPQYCYLEGSALGNGCGLYALVNLADGRSYNIFYGIVKDGRLLLVEEEEFLLADLEDK